jgi:hypothetical protein
VSDASLDREIEALLAVEPSPEFVARVRTRVAQESEPGRWRASWVLAAAGAVAAVIVAIIAWPSPEATPSNRTPVEPPRIAEAVPTIAPPQPAPLPERGRRTAVRAVATVERDRRGDIDLPEVVLADNEVKTFATLVASVRQSRFDVAVPAAPDPNTPLEIKELPPVEPLEIEPIVKVAALQAEGERP